MVHLSTHSSLHHVLKCSLLWSVVPSWCSKMSKASTCVFRMGLLSNWGSSIISLILIYSSHVVGWPSSFRQSPSRKVLLIWRILWGFRNIATWTHWVRSWGLVFQSSCASSSEPKCILRLFLIFRSFLGQILRTWSLFKCVQLHSRLSTNFRS